MTNNQSSKTEKVPCNHCNKQTSHIVHHVINKKVSEKLSSSLDPEEHEIISWCTTYTLLQCCGCDTVTLREEANFSEYESWEQELPKYYPPRTYRPLPRWAKESPEVDALPEDVKELLEEVYAALWSDSRRLAAMGARTLIDMFAVDKLRCDDGTFDKKLKELVHSEYIGGKQKDILCNALEAGSAAVHRNFKPDTEDLHCVMEIVENLLHFYVTEKASEELKPKVPKRPSKPEGRDRTRE